MMQSHTLKTLPPYFIEVWNGRKLFEVRFNDRNYRAGDEVVLKEYRAESNTYTGRSVVALISYVLSDEAYCKDGFVVFGLQILTKKTI